MTDTTRIEINGYSFEHDMGLAAKKEQTAIEYLTKQLDMNVPQTVMKVYKQIISQKLFHTQVGYDFLKGLQNYLFTNPEISNDDIDTIEIDSAIESMEAINAARIKRGEAAIGVDIPTNGKKTVGKADGKYRVRARIFLSTTIILLITVIAMFVITLTAKVPTVLNYQTVLNDRYEQMVKELENRQ